jgi:inhibitor of KinA sporulation pathway (predicted exonuclease)
MNKEEVMERAQRKINSLIDKTKILETRVSDFRRRQEKIRKAVQRTKTKSFSLPFSETIYLNNMKWDEEGYLQNELFGEELSSFYEKHGFYDLMDLLADKTKDPLMTAINSHIRRGFSGQKVSKDLLLEYRNETIEIVKRFVSRKMTEEEYLGYLSGDYSIGKNHKNEEVFIQKQYLLNA